MKKNIAYFFKALAAMGVSALAIVLVMIFCSFRYVTTTTEGLWKQLGITQQD